MKKKKNKAKKHSRVCGAAVVLEVAHAKSRALARAVRRDNTALVRSCFLPRGLHAAREGNYESREQNVSRRRGPLCRQAPLSHYAVMVLVTLLDFIGNPTGIVRSVSLFSRRWVNHTAPLQDCRSADVGPPCAHRPHNIYGLRLSSKTVGTYGLGVFCPTHLEPILSYSKHKFLPFHLPAVSIIDSMYISAWDTNIQ